MYDPKDNNDNNIQNQENLSKTDNNIPFSNDWPVVIPDKSDLAKKGFNNEIEER